MIASLVEPLFGATFTPTMLSAGQAVNVIPTHAEAEIDCRILPEMTPDETASVRWPPSSTRSASTGSSSGST